jgi:glycosyltransferase involved in cell wall biosynthesis
MANVLIDARRRRWNPTTGTGVYATRLAEELPALRTDLSIDVIDHSRLVDLTRPAQSALERFRRWPGKLASDLAEMPVRSRRAQLTHLLYPEGAALGRFVVTVQDLDVVDGGPRYPVSHRYYAWRTLALARRASAVLCPSQETADRLAAVIGRDDHIRVVHLAVDLPPDRRVTAPERPFLLYTGGSAIRKNVGLLFAAWELIHSRFDGELVVTGTFRDWTGRVPPGVRLVGPVGRDRLWDLYATSAAVVYPSPREGFGFPILEGALLGRPVVCGRVGITPELEPGTVLIADVSSAARVADGIQQVLDGWMPDAGAIRRARSHFTWRRCAQETADTYRSVL